jgi:4-amino-4-deoxychorismate lyase
MELSERYKHFGEGLFETFKVENGKLPTHFEYHYERLTKSANFFQIPAPTFEEFKTFVEKNIAFTKREGGAFAVKVLLLSLGGSYYGASATDYKLEIFIKKYTPPSADLTLTISPYRRHSANPIWRHKTTGGFIFNSLVKKEATSRGFYDALILNERGFITETSSANFYCLKDGTLLTPPLEDGLLPGITRRVLLEQKQAKEFRIEISFLKKCEKFFISNSLLGLREVKINFNFP